MKSKNAKLLKSFMEYCEKNPEQRFWQALRSWSGNDFILAGKNEELKDTYYSDRRDGR